jgi:hypothetical protein
VFCCSRSKPSQGSASAGLTLASDFSFCFQCQEGFSLVLRRPIEITAFTGHVPIRQFSMSGNATYQASVAYEGKFRATVKRESTSRWNKKGRHLSRLSRRTWAVPPRKIQSESPESR